MASQKNDLEWREFFKLQLQSGNLEKISKLVMTYQSNKKVLPPLRFIYNAFILCPLSKLKVVLIGQDPYPTDGHAMGLCFSAPYGVAIPASLRNIYKEMSDDGYIPNFQSPDLSKWATEGVFMINTALTVLQGQSNSHAKEWETFTEDLFYFINRTCKNVAVIMWGAQAKKYSHCFKNPSFKIFAAGHPSPINKHGGFLGSKPFSSVNRFLKEQGVKPIDWNLN